MAVIERIRSVGCGCGHMQGTKGLISIDDALLRIVQNTVPVRETEDLPLALARGRVLASSVRSRGQVPAFDNAAMDGYAIRSADLRGAGPWELSIRGRIAAGQPCDGRLPQACAFQVFTGAPVPEGADAVVMQEAVDRTGQTIVLTQAVEPRTNIRFAGEDMVAGKTVVPAGRRLSSRDIAACAAAGHGTVRVRRLITAALIVTGDEVRQVGEARGKAGIRDVNTPMLSAAMGAIGIALRSTEIAGDSRGSLREQIKALDGKVDLIVTTGGVSVGEEDHVKPALADLGARIAFSGVAIKPGKPVSFGRLSRTHWLGLPGNPLSAFVTWSLFGPPLFSALSGQDDGEHTRRHVVTSRPINHTPGRCELRPARIVGMDVLGREIVEFEDASYSGRVGALPDADGLIFLSSETDTLPEGALVEFHPFQSI
ncbi:gephyrin-like molybdotransferase Glp [uncultured Roseobacter sp.]|uniref:molybdopterin molybdotransferase MoeA n=1 Tax=uncultured Roseobacter sp. TaxID=114847 RepID=UPI0026354D4A|nr:gephyrin-like molybdotransferase Glp [uncultured Roseobacter sp.]